MRGTSNPKRLGWFQKFLWYWRSQRALIVELSASEAQVEVLREQLDELRRNARPVVTILGNDEYWGNLDNGVSVLVETLDFLDEIY